jgi:winged helix-turn helix protein
MRGRKPNELALSARDKRDLQKLLCDGHTPQRIAQRARILLACAEKQRTHQVAFQAGQQRSTVWRVCERYRQAGLGAALYDAPRSGHPRVFSPPRAQGD